MDSYNVSSEVLAQTLTQTQLHIQQREGLPTRPLHQQIMAEAVKEAVEGVKNLAVSGEQKPKKEKKKKTAEGADGRPLELSPPAAYVDHRIKIL